MESFKFEASTAMFNILKDKDLIDQMSKTGVHSKNGRARDLASTVTAIENTCRGGSLSLCRDKKRHGVISQSDWDQIVKCHHDYSNKIILSGGITFDLNEYDWHRDSRINDLTFDFGY